MQRSISLPVKRQGLLERGATGFLSGLRQKRVQRRAFERAYRAFRSTHTQCAELCFDRHFFLRRGAEALAHRDADALAYAWTTQFRYRDERQRARDVRRLKPLTESFLEGLELWEARLGRHA